MAARDMTPFITTSAAATVLTVQNSCILVSHEEGLWLPCPIYISGVIWPVWYCSSSPWASRMFSPLISWTNLMQRWEQYTVWLIKMTNVEHYKTAILAQGLGQSHDNMVIFYKMPVLTTEKFISQQLGQDMECLMWVSSVIYARLWIFILFLLNATLPSIPCRSYRQL